MKKNVILSALVFTLAFAQAGVAGDGTVTTPYLS